MLLIVSSYSVPYQSREFRVLASYDQHVPIMIIIILL